MATYTESQHRYQGSSSQYEHSIISASERSHTTDRSSKLPSLDKQLLYHSKTRVNKLYRCPITPEETRLHRREKGFVLDGCAVSSRAKYFDMLPTVIELKEKEDEKLTSRSNKRGFNFFEAIEYFKLRNRKNEDSVNESIPEMTRARSEVRKPARSDPVQPLKQKSPYTSEQKVGKSPRHKQRSKSLRAAPAATNRKRQNTNADSKAEASDNEDATNNVTKEAAETHQSALNGETSRSANEGLTMADEIEYVDDFADEPEPTTTGNELNNDHVVKNNASQEAEEQSGPSVERAAAEKPTEIEAAPSDEQKPSNTDNNRPAENLDDSPLDATSRTARGSKPQREDETVGNETRGNATLPIETNSDERQISETHGVAEPTARENDRFPQQENVKGPSEVPDSAAAAVHDNQKNDPEKRVIEAQASSSMGPSEKNASVADSGKTLKNDSVQPKSTTSRAEKPTRQETNKPVKVARKPPTVQIGVRTNRQLPPVRTPQGAVIQRRSPASNTFNRNKAVQPKRTEMLSIIRSKPLQTKDPKAGKMTGRPSPLADDGSTAKPKPKPALKTAPSYMRYTNKNTNPTNRQVRFQRQPGPKVQPKSTGPAYRNRNALSERTQDKPVGMDAKKAPIRRTINPQTRTSTLSQLNVKSSKPTLQTTARNRNIAAKENKPVTQNRNQETNKPNAANGKVPYRLTFSQSQKAQVPHSTVPQNSEVSVENYRGTASSRADLASDDKPSEKDQQTGSELNDKIAEPSDQRSDEKPISGETTDNLDQSGEKNSRELTETDEQSGEKNSREQTEIAEQSGEAQTPETAPSIAVAEPQQTQIANEPSDNAGQPQENPTPNDAPVDA